MFRAEFDRFAALILMELRKLAALVCHVDQEKSAAEIIAEGFDAVLVRRVLRLVKISEWKRRQSAPGPKLSRRAFGRERRYPITSGYAD